MENQITLLKAMRGDRQAFEHLITPYEQMVWRVCWQLMGNRYDAEDAAQITMIKAWKAVPQYRGDSAFSTWVYQIAVHTCMDELRKRDRIRPETQLFSETGNSSTDHLTPESEVIVQESCSEIRKALDQLDEDQKIPIVLYAIEEKTYDEISETLGIPSGTVKSRISRGRECLRRILGFKNSGKGAGK
ncbi:MAG: RNA polymerase sigma factor [Clostridia bacterium]|nr:RNA polymerase sigma factor [Clostridia bacterium]